MSEFQIVIHGEKSNDAEVVGEVLTACNDLWRAVCEQVTGDPDSVTLNLVAFKFCCDGCGTEVPKIPANWIKRGADDLCPACV